MPYLFPYYPDIIPILNTIKFFNYSWVLVYTHDILLSSLLTSILPFEAIETFANSIGVSL